MIIACRSKLAPIDDDIPLIVPPDDSDLQALDRLGLLHQISCLN